MATSQNSDAQSDLKQEESVPVNTKGTEPEDDSDETGCSDSGDEKGPTPPPLPDAPTLQMTESELDGTSELVKPAIERTFSHLSTTSAGMAEGEDEKAALQELLKQHQPPAGQDGKSGEGGADDPEVEDNECRNLIINYLPPSFTEDDLMHYFGPYGNVENCKVVMDLRTGKSKGFGFIKYSKKENAKRAMESLNGYNIKKKFLKVAFARKHCKEIRNSNLYVTHLPKTLTDKGLRDLFSKYGKLIECRVLKDKQNRCRGVGFVRFDSHKNAIRAMDALNKCVPGGWQKEIRMKLASKRSDYSLGPGWSHNIYTHGPNYHPRVSPRMPPMSPWHGSPYHHGKRMPPPFSPGWAGPPSFYHPGGPPPFSPGHDPRYGQPYNSCFLESPRGGFQPYPMPMQQGGRGSKSRGSLHTVVVTNIDKETSLSELQEFFSDMSFHSGKVITKPRGNRNYQNNFRPHAFVNFTKKSDARKAVGSEGLTLRDSTLIIKHRD